MTNNKISVPSTTTNNIPTKGHERQQASIGLGIVTHANVNFSSPQQPRRESISKNDTFFDISTSYQQLKPPHSLINTTSRMDYSVKHPPTALRNHAAATAAAAVEQDNQQISSPPTFADRIRCIVLANRKSAIVAPTPTTAEKNINSSDDSDSIHSSDSSSSSSSCDSNSIHENMLFPEEKIIPLPSPAQPLLVMKSNTCCTPNPLFTKHSIITPTIPTAAMVEEEQPPTSAIPIISLSPNFSPNKTNIIPSLLEVPMLGDMDDPTYYHPGDDDSILSTATSKFPFFSPATTKEDDNLIGKHIWKFRIKQLLGVGAFSKVYLADNIEEGGKFAVKMIKKEKMREDLRVKSSIEREVGVLKFLDHDRIVQLEATMETEQHLCIVLEFVQGEELFEFVQRMHTDIHQEKSQSSIDERLIKRLALELIQVVSWLHDHNIVHRDLKLENILVYYDNQGESHLKITDFGLARVVNPDEPTLTTRCGSEEYAAPEIVQSLGYNGRLTDTWSIGIILYALLVGYLPFSYNASKGEKLSHMFHRIVLAQVKWPTTDNISPEAKEVVNSILVRQPEKRIRLNQLEKLAWFNN